MHPIARLLVATYVLLRQARAAGEPCLLANNRLDPTTHYFHSDCSDKEYCGPPFTPPASSGAIAPPTATEDDISSLFKRQGAQTICQPKGCRRDEDPFGFDPAIDVLPPTCEDAQFCPDEGSDCRDLVSLGGACQLGRDDQCVDPPKAANSGKAICLKYVCLWANATAGLPCKIEDSVYSGYGADGNIAYSEIVTRSTCLSPSLYCSPQSLVCVPSQPLGATCAADVECQSASCGLGGLCEPIGSLPTDVPSWAYVLSAFLLLALLLGTSWTLYVVHRRERRARVEAKKRLLVEQDRYRRAIAELGAAALLSAAGGKATSVALTRGESFATSYTLSSTGSFSGQSYAYEPSISSVSAYTRRRSPG